jgi:hypothetical protein
VKEYVKKYAVEETKISRNEFAKKSEENNESELSNASENSDSEME